MPERHVPPTPHDAMLTRWRSRVASRLASPTTSTLDIPTAPIPPAPPTVVAPSTDIISPVDAPPEISRRRAILIRPRQDIPIGRLYHTHPGRPCRALIVRKSVRPLPSHRLALWYTSHHLDHFTFRLFIIWAFYFGSFFIWTYTTRHHQTPPLLIHLHHQDLFIHHLLGLYGIARPITVLETRKVSVTSKVVTSLSS
ncbi:hypothetical protein Tco_0220328 [Tanacetum coccineum]